MTPKKSGYAAIVGRPNVGKSTLLNYVLQQKISITSRKPQTTRHQVLGIKSEDDYQIVFVDTPGLNAQNDRAINRYLNRTASSALRDVDVVLFVVDRMQWNNEDDYVLDRIMEAGRPVILVINKIDLLADKAELLPWLAEVATRANFHDIVPISALSRHNIDALESCIVGVLPVAEFMFPADQVTDRSQRFLVAELIREKIMRQLGDELPYAAAVEVESFKDDGRIIHISALILVEREGQKRIIIGDKGSRLRSIGTEARKDIEAMLENKVMLKLWVKVKSGWSDDDRALKSLGYDDLSTDR
jgi:GTP-binding protein Era